MNTKNTPTPLKRKSTFVFAPTDIPPAIADDSERKSALIVASGVWFFLTAVCAYMSGMSTIATLIEKSPPNAGILAVMNGGFAILCGIAGVLTIRRFAR